MIRTHIFPHVSRRLHVFVSRFDWFTVLSLSFVIGQSDNFGLGCTKLYDPFGIFVGGACWTADRAVWVRALAGTLRYILGQCLSPPRCIEGTGEFTTGGNPAMD